MTKPNRTTFSVQKSGATGKTEQMTTPKFKLGDVVSSLKNPKQLMCVNRIIRQELLECQWFDAVNRLHKHVFKSHEIVHDAVPATN